MQRAAAQKHRFSSTVSSCMMTRIEVYADQGVIIQGVIIQGVIIQGVIIQGVIIQGVILQGVIIQGVIIQGGIIQGVIIQGGNIKGGMGTKGAEPRNETDWNCPEDAQHDGKDGREGVARLHPRMRQTNVGPKDCRRKSQKSQALSKGINHVNLVIATSM